MNKLIITLLYLITIFNIPASFGGDKDGRYAIRGAGLLSCKVFLEERPKKSPAYMMIGGWLDGYITAYNKLQQDTFDVSPYASTELLGVVIGQHCKDNPDDLLGPILDSILARLNKDKLDTASPFVTVTVGDYETSLYARTIQEIQTRLSQKGLFKGISNGNWNDETTAAVARYQKAIGYNASGYPDQKTLWYLFRSKE
ncbi:MAG: peptidoglycan-binding protein [Emcibacter sp.]|nr:peptidoglycan-binding protein [Emcibacter sp.]